MVIACGLRLQALDTVSQPQGGHKKMRAGHGCLADWTTYRWQDEHCEADGEKGPQLIGRLPEVCVRCVRYVGMPVVSSLLIADRCRIGEAVHTSLICAAWSLLGVLSRDAAGGVHT